MDTKPWQLQVFAKSIKKKEKLGLIERHLRVAPASKALDLGCAQGMLSHFLRRKGGAWVHADQDLTNLESTRTLVGGNVIQVGAGRLPFKNASFDLIAAPDYLEHLEDDDLCLQEAHRILKKGGRLFVVVPRTGGFFLLHKLRPVLGLRLEYYGHKREGYSLRELRSKLERARFTLTGYRTYSRAFSEFFELILNALYVRFFSRGRNQGLRDGHIRPTTSDEFASRKKVFRLYAFVYPLVWLMSKLDLLLFFQKGYALLAWAQKNE